MVMYISKSFFKRRKLFSSHTYSISLFFSLYTRVYVLPIYRCYQLTNAAFILELRCFVKICIKTWKKVSSFSSPYKRFFPVNFLSFHCLLYFWVQTAIASRLWIFTGTGFVHIHHFRFLQRRIRFAGLSLKMV